MAFSVDTIRKTIREKNNITPTTTFGELVRHKAEIIGDKVFLTFVRDFDKNIDEKYTYKDMHLKSNQLANGLLKLGMK
ncbi:MAG TPA: hypothetical protein ENI29_22305, partial [bacterium]|nr:hypothetical protein [bacterium]